MSAHMPGFLSFFSFLHHFALAKLATSGIRVKKGSFTLPILRLLSRPKINDAKRFENHLKIFFRFFASFCIGH